MDFDLAMAHAKNKRLKLELKAKALDADRTARQEELRLQIELARLNASKPVVASLGSGTAFSANNTPSTATSSTPQAPFATPAPSTPLMRNPLGSFNMNMGLGDTPSYGSHGQSFDMLDNSNTGYAAGSDFGQLLGDDIY